MLIPPLSKVTVLLYFWITAGKAALSVIMELHGPRGSGVQHPPGSVMLVGTLL